MELKVKNPNTSEIFSLKIDTIRNNEETIYKVIFFDKRLIEVYENVEIKRKPNNFWKFPENADNFLISLISEIIFQIMNNEVSI